MLEGDGDVGCGWWFLVVGSWLLSLLRCVWMVVVAEIHDVVCLVFLGARRQ